MSVVKWIRKKPRLATLVTEAGGVSVRQALAAVPLHVEPLREDCVAAVDGHIAALEACVAAGPPQDLRPALDDLYSRGEGILDAAGPFDLEDVCKAAWSLCELVDRSRRSGAGDWRAVVVHVQALRLLRLLPPEDSAGRAEILDGLGRLLAKTTAAR